MKTFLVVIAGLFMLSSCNSKKENSTQTEPEAISIETPDKPIVAEADTDTTVYQAPHYTASLENALPYFKKNNKYKDWDANDERNTVIQCVIEKEGTPSRIRIIRSSGKEELDNEAIRLIREGTYAIGKNMDEETRELKEVRSLFTILVFFPPK